MPHKIPAIAVVGTDTGIGKTVFAAALTLGLDGNYWKPIQSGTKGGTDTGRVRKMTKLPERRLLPERYVFRNPLSPHRAAELDGVAIRPERLSELPAARPLIIEAAGGLLVPITRSLLQIDLIRRWEIPVVLCSRTALGTINHSLLSVEALRRRNIPLLGIAFIGDENADTERTIIEFAKTKRLGRLPRLPRLTPANLKLAFRRNFKKNDFLLPATRGGRVHSPEARIAQQNAGMLELPLFWERGKTAR